MESAVKHRKLKKEYPFAIYDKRKKCYAGCTRFYEFLSDFNTIKLGHTWLGKEFWGSGLNTHCKYVLFEFVFDKLGIDRIGFGAYIDNKISIKAMESVGCKKEGVLRDFFPAINSEGRKDAILYSILRNEWSRNAKNKLKNKLIKA